MPKSFDKCVRRGGKVRTITGKNAHFEVPEGHYRRICMIDGKTTKGHLKLKKKT